jgi:hypothetical protein
MGRECQQTKSRENSTRDRGIRMAGTGRFNCRLLAPVNTGSPLHLSTAVIDIQRIFRPFVATAKDYVIEIFQATPLYDAFVDKKFCNEANCTPQL